MNSLEDFKILRFSPEDHRHDLDEITDMLHRAYRPLLEKGLRYLASEQPVEKTLERLQHGPSFLGFYKDRIVATVTLNLKERHSSACCAWYQKPGVYCFQQFAVDPDVQNLGIGRLMLQTIESEAIKRGATELALDTSEQAHELIATHKRHGYRIVDAIDWSVTNYVSVVMSKHLGEPRPR